MRTIAKLHYITQDIVHHSHASLATAACQGGVRWVQFRAKGLKDAEWIKIAHEVRGLCRKFQATFIVNDSVEVAKACDADGVHLGKDDMDPRKARDILGDTKIIGGTAHTFEEILSLREAGVNYIGIGPFRFTRTKEKLRPVLGLEGIHSLVSRSKSEGIKIPLIAIGGVRSTDLSDLFSIGVHGVAVASAINEVEEREESARGFMTQLEREAI